jgi:hypothetical protein
MDLLDQKIDPLWALVDTVMKAWDLWTSRDTVTFSTRTLFRGVRLKHLYCYLSYVFVRLQILT